ncbi:hypothetical protein [Runella sp.]|uniref:hypothetical protein n=1 Tax=Runella sp. TaxID=1960881 RepID=UPI003D0C59D5
MPKSMPIPFLFRKKRLALLLLVLLFAAAVLGVWYWYDWQLDRLPPADHYLPNHPASAAA